MGREALKWMIAAAGAAWVGGCTALLGLDDKTFDRDEGAAAVGGGGGGAVSASGAGAGGSGSGGGSGGPGAVCGGGEVPSATTQWFGVTTSTFSMTTVGGIAIDGTSGAIWLAGSFQGSVTLPGCAEMTTLSGQAVFWARLSAAGACEASGVLGGMDFSNDLATARGIAVDSQGYAVLVGRFSGSMTSGPTTIPSTGADDIFVIKLDPSGAHVWARNYGESSFDSAEAVVTETADQIFFTGTLGTVTFGDLYMHRLDADGLGITDWSYTSQGDDRVNAVAFSPNVPFALAGYIGATADLYGTELPTKGKNAFVAAIRADGTAQRAVANPGDGTSVGRAVALDKAGHYMFAAGDFSQKLDLDGDLAAGGLETLTVDETDGFLVRLDISEVEPARYAQLGQPGDGQGNYNDHIAAMALDPVTENSLAVAGSVRGRSCFLGAEREAVVGGDDLFVAEVDAELNGPLWVSVFGDAGSGGDQVAAAVAIHPGTGEVIVAGTFNGSLDLGVGPPLTGPRVGSEVFIVALDRP